VPVPDVEISGITATELQSYEEFSRMYLAQWQRVDPVIVGVKRDEKQTPSGRREKVSLDVHISPYARQHYGFFAGFLLYIGVSDILPEAHSKNSSLKLIGLTILGVIFVFLVSRFI